MAWKKCDSPCYGELCLLRSKSSYISHFLNKGLKTTLFNHLLVDSSLIALSFTVCMFVYYPESFKVNRYIATETQIYVLVNMDLVFSVVEKANLAKKKEISPFSFLFFDMTRVKFSLSLCLMLINPNWLSPWPRIKPPEIPSKPKNRSLLASSEYSSAAALYKKEKPQHLFILQ